VYGTWTEAAPPAEGASPAPRTNTLVRVGAAKFN